MPLNKQEREEKDDREKNSKLYRLLIGVGFFLFLIVAWWAMMKLNSRLMEMRANFVPFMKRILLLSFILVVIFIIIIALLNFWGKQSQRDEHQSDED